MLKFFILLLTLIPFNLSQKLQQGPLSGKVIAILGDSIIQNMSSQKANVDTQDWPLLQRLTDAKLILNCATGGAMWRDKGDEYITNRPVQASNTSFISNQVRLLERLIKEGRPQPDIIFIAAGTNDIKTPKGNYLEIMEMTFSELEHSEQARKTLYGGLRYSIEKILTDYPKTNLVLFTPFQAIHGERNYEVLSDIGAAIKKMGNRYAVTVVDCLNEGGISDIFEVNRGRGRYLADGVHPNREGKILMSNFYAKKLLDIYVPNY